MFPWNIAKSAEAMFSRWAIKRVCTFLLKKKLGKFILGEVDLNQLDVQLSAGTIQLSDLALNVDYINQKLGASAAITVKEGSIGSLLVKMPWKAEGCRIEVDELELVIVPCRRNVSVDGSKTSASSENDNYHPNHDSGKLKQDKVASNMLSSVDVHEGVKTVAKMVKWLLSSFQVKVSKLIIAFDPCGEKKMNKRYCRTLVLRIAEIECGTHISEDAQLLNEPSEDDFLGLSRLTNFLKFQGAVLEFLQMDDVEHQMSNPCPPETSYDECFLASSQATAMTPIFTGKNGGFSGHIKLIIPWKNGSLDIRRVDADASIDPLELRFQPSTVISFIYLWETFKNKSTRTEGPMSCNLTDSVYSNSRSIHNSSTPGPCSLASDMVAENECSVIHYSSLLEEECKRDTLISEPHVISDWVGRNQEDRTCAEPDFGASVDQFFECLDELRSSQSVLGNSGMWNWTRSVFTAITAASNLASGSLHIPSELSAVQQHVETNFKVTVAKISLLFSFFDEDPVHSCGEMHDQAKADSYARYLGLEFDGLLLVLQEMNFEATVEHVEIYDHFSPENDPMDLKLRGQSDCIKSRAGLIQKMQDGVQDALAPFCSSSEDAWMVNWSGYDAESELSLDSKSIIQNISRKGIYRDDVVKVSLLKTSGIGHCQVTINSQTSANVFMGPTSFTLKLPPFILWVNFGIVDMISDLLKQIESSEMSSRKNDFGSEALCSQRRSYSQENEAKGTCSRASSISTNESLRGSIFLLNARIILCFPYKNGADSGSYSFFDQFIALHFSSPTNLEDKKVEASKPASVTSSRKENVLQRSRSLHLTLGNLGAYFITADTLQNVAGESCSMVKLKFFGQKIMSTADGSTSFSVISMYWQDGAFTGSQIIKRAKILATAGNLTGKRFKGEDYEFASVTSVKDVEDLDTLNWQEIILSSGFVLHAKLSPVNVNLEKSQYHNLIFILHQLNGGVPSMEADPVNQECPSQASILVECESVEVAVSMEVVESVKGSIQKELPGSWHSFKLKVRNFELLSVSNIGGIRDASFLWVVHREGNLLGSVTGVPHEEMLLISCSNSTMGRGDGEGSNVLCPRFSGSDFVYLWHPEDLHCYMSIAVKCGTIVAIGGRLDWWDAISSFFILPSPEIEQAGDGTIQEGNSEINRPCGSSFVLNLVDVALSYEPYFYDHVDHEGSVMESCSASIDDAIDEQFFACLLAASSLRLSNTRVSNSPAGEYKIQVQDVGLLLCPVSGPKTVGGTYDVEHLRLVGYLKIAQEAHFEALLRTFSEPDLVWEVESLRSQIFLNTCYDTAAGLIRLCAQLQQLFAPDVEDTVVHLENRWNNFRMASESTENKTFDGGAAPSDSMLQDLGTKTKPLIGDLMDEICEDAFVLDAGDYQGDYHDQHLHLSFDDILLGEPSDSGARNGESFSGSFPFGGSISIAGLENDGMSPELLEEYFLPDLCPLSELSLRGQSSKILDCKTSSTEEIPIRNTGWYGDTSLRILENHVSDVNKQTNLWQLEDMASSSHTDTDGYGKVKGSVLLKDMNVVWRMYAGSDWHNFKKSSAVTSGRDATVCLEISLLGMKVRYDLFPDGGICVSRLSLSAQDFFISDNSKNAPWKLVLGYYQSKDHPRKSSSKAFKLDLESVRPDPSTPLEEYRLRVAFLPMRLHLHQSQLDFLINFFGGASVESSQSDSQDLCGTGTEPRKSTNFGGRVIIEEALLPYFQKFDIWPVLIRVDYSPSHVDLAALGSGKYVELVNLVPWKGVELQLKHVHAVGVYGWSCVCETVIGEWLEDISQTQIHKLLKGLPPIRSLVAVGSGATKLVTLPVKNYRKDKKLLKGMQRGAVAFLRSISLEAIGLGVHLAAGAHDILVQAEYILTNIPPSVSWNPESQGNINVRSNQPKDARQGIKQAYESISDGLGKSASVLVRTPLKSYQRDGGMVSALATAVRAAPVAAMAPASATARAMHNILLGVRNSLDPEHKKESLEKYLGTTQHREFMQ